MKPRDLLHNIFYVTYTYNKFKKSSLIPLRYVACLSLLLNWGGENVEKYENVALKLKKCAKCWKSMFKVGKICLKFPITIFEVQMLFLCVSALQMSFSIRYMCVFVCMCVEVILGTAWYCQKS